MGSDALTEPTRLQRARQALAAERQADEAVDKILADLADLNESAIDRVLSRLVVLLQDGPQEARQAVSAIKAPLQPPAAAATFSDLPEALQGGAKALKRLSGLPEDAICERVAGWAETRGEEAVVAAFEAMKQERPSHEISFIEQYLGLE